MNNLYKYPITTSDTVGCSTFFSHILLHCYIQLKLDFYLLIQIVMASAESGRREHDTLSQFDKIRQQIRNKFSRTHLLLQKREAALLAEVQTLEEMFHGQDIADEMKQLYLSKEHLENTLKGNKSREIIQQSIAPINQKIAELKILLEKAQEMKNINLEWNDDLEDQLNMLGTIRVISQKKSSKLVPDYKKKGVPLAAFGKHDKHLSTEPGVFCHPESIIIDTMTDHFYISDYGNDRVQVFNKSFQFLFMFNKKMNGPSGISFFQDTLYVTQSRGNNLNIYSREIISISIHGNGF